MFKSNNKDPQKESTPLCNALFLGNLAEAQKILDQGFDINTKDKNGCTALHRAVITQNQTVIKFLLDANADVNVQDSQGLTSLHYAASLNDKEIIADLLSAGANHDIVSSYYSSLPMDYVYYNKEIIELFKENKARSSIEERKLVHLGLKIKTKDKFTGFISSMAPLTFQELIEKLTKNQIDDIKKKHPDKHSALDMLSNIIEVLKARVSELREIEHLPNLFMLSNDATLNSKINVYKNKCKNLTIKDHCIIEGVSIGHANYLVVNLEQNGKYRVQLCERNGAVFKNSKALIPYIVVSHEELNQVIEKTVKNKKLDYKKAKRIIFGLGFYDSTLFGFPAKTRDDITPEHFTEGTCTISNLKTATRLILIDLVNSLNEELTPEKRVSPEEVYKVYSAALFDVALEDYKKCDHSFFQGSEKDKIIEEAETHSKKKWNTLFLNKLLDSMLNPTKEPRSRIRSINPFNVNNHYTQLKKMLADNITEDKELMRVLKDNPDKLELYANSVLKALSEIEFKGSKGAYFTHKAGKTESNLLNNIANFIISALYCIVTLSIEPMKCWYNDKPQIIVWRPKKFDEFLKDPNKHITAEQIAKGKQTLANIIKAEFRREEQSRGIV